MSLQGNQVLKPLNVAKQLISQCNESPILVYCVKEKVWIFFLRLIVAFTAHTPSFPAPFRTASDP